MINILEAVVIRGLLVLLILMVLAGWAAGNFVGNFSEKLTTNNCPKAQAELQLCK